MSTHYILNAGVGFVNVSPQAFRKWAAHYYQCRQTFRCDESFSPVPYFLLCRAIELQLKAMHLERLRQPEVKLAYGHNLVKSYEALSLDERALSSEQFAVLRAASNIYRTKGFEYWNPEHALSGYSQFPELVSLDGVAGVLLRT